IKELYSWFNGTYKLVMKDNNYSHFYLNIYPRISRHAGFEITTGIIQNSVSPERAAKKLKINDEK
ncbi:galactose-1-phosphate uridylyltransferase, partial [Clostridium tetanomorphum DSM 665]